MIIFLFAALFFDASLIERLRGLGCIDKYLLSTIDPAFFFVYFLINLCLFMPFFRNFIYWIDKRRWKFSFLQAALDMSSALL